MKRGEQRAPTHGCNSSNPDQPGIPLLNLARARVEKPKGRPERCRVLHDTNVTVTPASCGEQQWSSCELPNNDVEPLNDLQQQIIDKASKELSLELNRVDNLHMSLTKTFVIRHHNITAFVEDIRNAVSGSKRFIVLPSNLAIYVNEEQTRTFLAVKIDETSFRPLEQLVDALDGCMREYKLPVFYQERSFHVSILWTLGNQRDKLEGILPELDELFNAIYEEEYCDMNVNVKRLHLKCGNKFYDFGLV
ncbi:conserved hypothetical protein [Culex quinquefasciatus]|uniref:U6 snRNA phosphodiesterase 1 n=1 Tax=Culex quinquefasciatus TaxID=7176 RepID=B0XKJ6_CULQU|nr:conserved hypothetical protein [Culex quinquefasciatus]|eukprot:XP_001870168.1 conserved hypothetical protein [Culex quinquefasciatus]